GGLAVRHLCKLCAWSEGLGGGWRVRSASVTKMSTRLYYDDSYLRQFEAAIVRVEVRGNRQAVWLDRTGFYPTSGGQPADTGTLDAVPVAGVEVDEADDV